MENGNNVQPANYVVRNIYTLFCPGYIFSSAVPSDNGAFQMPTRPSSAASTLRGGTFQMPTRPSSAASTLRGGRANLRNASVTFSLFCHEASFG